jgi:transglutaminase-like putative cysteine protease
MTPLRARVPLVLAVLPASLPTDAAAVPVLHEYVPGLADAPTQVVGGGEAGENPDAIIVGSEPVPEPEAPATLPTHRAGDPAGHNYSFTPDLVTRLDGRLPYLEEFTPSIVPFKRSKVLDTIEMPGYRLVVGDRAFTEVPVEGSGASTPQRDLFWVTLQLDLGAAPVPIPSPSPDVRVLSYRATPEVPLAFLRDGADNLYVRRADAASRRAPEAVRVTLLTDASAAYFGAELPADLRVSDLPAPPMPESARAAGLEVARALAIPASLSVREAIARLVAHFRSFEEADEALVVHGDVYKDLALGRRGVCRHRSFAFMVTANALGLRARYVENDAHAFVEVLLPDTGWMRIDLGGAAAGIDIENASDRPRHEPRRPDDLPQPPAYRQSYSLLAAPGVHGAPRPVDRGSVPAPVPADAAGPAEGPVDPTAIPGGPRTAAGGAPAAGAARPPGPALVPTVTRIVDSARRARRGTSIGVSGFVRSADGPLPGMLVEVFLSIDGRTRRQLLGRQVTGDDGRFTGEFLLPADLEPRRYHVLAGTPGDASHAPSQSPP